VQSTPCSIQLHKYIRLQCVPPLIKSVSEWYTEIITVYCTNHRLYIDMCEEKRRVSVLKLAVYTCTVSVLNLAVYLYSYHYVSNVNTQNKDQTAQVLISAPSTIQTRSNLYSVTYVPQPVLRRHGSDSNKVISTIPCTMNYITNMLYKPNHINGTCFSTCMTNCYRTFVSETFILCPAFP
jgi:hypothetical protein